MTSASLKHFFTTRPKFQWTLFILVIIIVTLIFQGAGLSDSFLSDDFDWVTTAKNNVESGNWFAPFVNETGGNFFRPLVAFGFQIDYLLGGFNPLPYHLHQLFFHILLVAGISFLVFQLTENKILSFLSGGLFLFFPNHQEVVTWLAGRPDLYAATFSVWAIGFYAQFLKTKLWYAYAISLVLSFCALLSKEIAFILPVLILGTLVFLKTLRPIKKLAKHFLLLIPWAILTIAVLLLRKLVLSDAIGGYVIAGNHLATDIADSHPSQIFLSLFNFINWSYLSELLNNSILYRGLHAIWNWMLVYWSIAFMVTSVGMFFLIRHKERPQKKLFWFAIGWILFSFIPVFGLTDEISTSRLVASRLFFFASIGYAMILAVALSPKNLTKISRGFYAILIVILLFFSILWKINSTPWHTAAHRIARVTNAVETYADTHTLKPNGVIVGDNLPDIVHGAYAFFGRHTFPGVLTQAGIPDTIRSFQTNGSRYSDSPFCPCSEVPVDVLSWNSELENFNSLDTLSARLQTSTATCSQQKTIWDFSHGQDISQWNIHGFENQKKENGLELSIPAQSDGYLESPELDNVFSGDFRLLTISFSVDEHLSGTENKAVLAWKTDKGYSVSRQIGYTYTEGKKKTISIPLCEFINWAVSGDVLQLRIRPITGANITLHAITLE